MSKNQMTAGTVCFFSGYTHMVTVGVKGLTRVRAYYSPENLSKTPKIRWLGVRVYAENKIPGVEK